MPAALVVPTLSTNASKTAVNFFTRTPTKETGSIGAICLLYLR